MMFNMYMAYQQANAFPKEMMLIVNQPYTMNSQRIPAHYFGVQNIHSLLQLHPDERVKNADFQKLQYNDLARVVMMRLNHEIIQQLKGKQGAALWLAMIERDFGQEAVVAYQSAFQANQQEKLSAQRFYYNVYHMMQDFSQKIDALTGDDETTEALKAWNQRKDVARFKALDKMYAQYVEVTAPEEEVVDHKFGVSTITTTTEETSASSSESSWRHWVNMFFPTTIAKDLDPKVRHPYAPFIALGVSVLVLALGYVIAGAISGQWVPHLSPGAAVGVSILTAFTGILTYFSLPEYPLFDETFEKPHRINGYEVTRMVHNSEGEKLNQNPRFLYEQKRVKNDSTTAVVESDTSYDWEGSTLAVDADNKLKVVTL